MKNNILIVDDEPANLRLLERFLKNEYEVMTATSGAEALDLLVRFDAELIISDQRMPGMTGIQFLKKAAELRPRTVRIILTGYTDVADLVESINSGVVYRYITKPWVNTDLLQSVRSGIEHYTASRNQHLLKEENVRLQARLHTSVQSYINLITDSIAQKKNGLLEHCRRTSKLATQIGEQMRLVSFELDELRVAAMLHEAASLRLPFDLDLKRSALTAEQLKVTRASYERGVNFLSVVPDLEGVANIIAFQYEHFDGQGLFHGLEGEKIPMASRVLAVANAFDDFERPRSATLSRLSGEPIERLQSLAGNALDPLIVEACLGINIARPVNPPRIPMPIVPLPASALMTR